jgi:hypothetical protein
VIPRRRKPTRKNTRRARGRRTNRERPTAPYRTGDIAAVRVIPPSGEGAQAHAYATTREAGHQRRFRFRATASVAPVQAEPGNGSARVPSNSPATAERDAS